MIKKIKSLRFGESIKWSNCPLSCGMVSDALGSGFSVRWITENWEASIGHILITRRAA
jgi:hypothetical protein